MNTKNIKTQLPSYVIPTTMGAFNSGAIHNAMCLYLLTHYDSNLYAGYPHKVSVQGYDSLAALFAADSLTAFGGGSLSPSDLAVIDSAFDTAFSNGWSGIFPNHLQMETTLYNAESAGTVASDEVEFIRNADSVLALCPSFAVAADTIASQQTQWSNITWTPSQTSGYAAYMYLSIASASCSFWGPGGAGSSLNPPLPPEAEYIADTQGAMNNMFKPPRSPSSNLGGAGFVSSACSFSMAVNIVYSRTSGVQATK
jgi:hypothetical protein